MRCVESLRTQAYFDHELDSPGAAEIEGHARHCAECCSSLEDLKQLRTALRRELAYESAAFALKARIAGTLSWESIPKFTPVHRLDLKSWRPQSFWQGTFVGIAGMAIAAGIFFLVVVRLLSSSLPKDLLSAHVRSLMPEHLIDVVSTDKHSVKAWFSGRADVSPTVADFEMQGYKLIGGRADYLGHQRVAVVVYQRGSHIINVFSWDANQSALPRNATRGGYHVACWQSGGVAYCAISDTGWGELTGLVKLIQASSER